MTHLAAGRSLPPVDGDVWHLLFARFQRMAARGEEIWPHPGWAANRHGVADTHIPECFTRVHFHTAVVTDRADPGAASAH